LSTKVGPAATIHRGYPPLRRGRRSRWRQAPQCRRAARTTDVSEMHPPVLFPIHAHLANIGPTSSSMGQKPTRQHVSKDTLPHRQHPPADPGGSRSSTCPGPGTGHAAPWGSGRPQRSHCVHAHQAPAGLGSAAIKSFYQRGISSTVDPCWRYIDLNRALLTPARWCDRGREFVAGNLIRAIRAMLHLQAQSPVIQSKERHL
jgi:hypothetical protein